MKAKREFNDEMLKWHSMLTSARLCLSDTRLEHSERKYDEVFEKLECLEDLLKHMHRDLTNLLLHT